MINNRKRIIIISALGAAAVAAAAICIMMTSRIRGGNPTGEALSQNINPIEAASQTEEPTVYVDNTVDIIDVNSKTRPFAVSVNNTPVAVQVQTGLNKAYIVYELPTESYTCRLLALFKVEDSDVTDEAPQEIIGSGNVSQTDTVIGTIRSARHNFLDFCFESDAIFVHLAEALTLRVMRQRLVLTGLTASITVHIIGDIIRKGLQQSIQHIHRFTG